MDQLLEKMRLKTCFWLFQRGFAWHRYIFSRPLLSRRWPIYPSLSTDRRHANKKRASVSFSSPASSSAWPWWSNIVRMVPVRNSLSVPFTSLTWLSYGLSYGNSVQRALSSHNNQRIMETGAVHHDILQSFPVLLWVAIIRGHSPLDH